MIYVFEGGSAVFDGSTITEEQKAQAVAVEVLPVPVIPAGKMAVLKADKTQNKIWYDYVDIPKNEHTELTQRINLLEKAVNDLALGGI